MVDKSKFIVMMQVQECVCACFVLKMYAVAFNVVIYGQAAVAMETITKLSDL